MVDPTLTVWHIRFRSQEKQYRQVYACEIKDLSLPRRIQTNRQSEKAQ